MPRPRLLRLLLPGLPALAIAAAAQALLPPTAVVEPLLAAAPQGHGQVLAATIATPDREDATVATPVPTAAPTPVPTPVPTAPPAAPAPRPAVAVHAPPPAPPPPPPPPAPLRNRLVSQDGRLDTGVGVYSDCTGVSEVPHTVADVDTCMGGRTYFVGHNPGVFTPLMSETVGSVITWWDAAGNEHRLRIVARRDWMRADGVPGTVSGAVVAQFQTCLVADGSEDVILDAVPA